MAACGSTCDSFGGNGCRRWLGDPRWSSVAIKWFSMCGGNGGIGDGVSSDGDGLDDVRIGGFGPIFIVPVPCKWCFMLAESSMNIALPLHWVGGVWNVTLCLASKSELENWSKLICSLFIIIFIFLKQNKNNRKQMSKWNADFGQKFGAVKLVIDSVIFWWVKQYDESDKFHKYFDSMTWLCSYRSRRRLTKTDWSEIFNAQQVSKSSQSKFKNATKSFANLINKHWCSHSLNSMWKFKMNRSIVHSSLWQKRANHVNKIIIVHTNAHSINMWPLFHMMIWRIDIFACSLYVMNHLFTQHSHHVSILI